MRKTMVWAGLALTALLALSGCTKVRKCTVGEQGCVGDAGPYEDNTCADGLELRGGKCVEPAGSNCNCGVGEACDEDTQECVGYCDVDEVSPAVKPTPQGCAAPNVDGQADYTYRDVCISTCEQTCLRAQAYCPGYICDLATCDSLAALCNTACPAQDLNCMTLACEKQRDTSCETFQCPAGSGPRDCSNVRCSDSCDALNIADGFCDDGDPRSADYSLCQYGTDCSDCGPRKGARPPRVALGELCPAGQDVACEGYNDDFLKGSAWCLPIIDDSSAPFRCVPGCNTADGPGECPSSDYECTAVLTRDGDPFTDLYKHPGYYCQPLVCE